MVVTQVSFLCILTLIYLRASSRLILIGEISIMESQNFPYLHGFSTEEQDRLRHQAFFLEQKIYSAIDFHDAKTVLEVGCGVGAQTEILLRRFGNLHVTAIDSSEKQLLTAESHLSKLSFAAGRYNLSKMNAANLELESGSFDGAFLCWVLEHVDDPSRVLGEIRRVLGRGGRLVATEVMNSSFFLEPYSPNTWKYWMAFNDFQYDNSGDPFIGAKLGNLLLSQGYKNIRTKVISWHLDNRQPRQRSQAVRFWKNLLLSAADQLIDSKYVDQDTVQGMKEELSSVEKDPNAVMFYSFVQAEAESE